MSAIETDWIHEKFHLRASTSSFRLHSTQPWLSPIPRGNRTDSDSPYAKAVIIPAKQTRPAKLKGATAVAALVPPDEDD